MARLDTWDFIEKHHPNYYSDDRVAACDDLQRVLDGNADEAMGTRRTMSKRKALEEHERLECALLQEARDAKEGQGVNLVNARIDMVNGLFNIVNDDTGESMGTGFRTQQLAEQSALDHECSIVS